MEEKALIMKEEFIPFRGGRGTGFNLLQPVGRASKVSSI